MRLGKADRENCFVSISDQHTLPSLCHWSLLGERRQLPGQRDIDRPLVLGSRLFGIGWRLARFCPGPAVVATSPVAPKAVTFTTAMIVGMGVLQLLNGSPARARP